MEINIYLYKKGEKIVNDQIEIKQKKYLCDNKMLIKWIGLQ